MSESQTDIEQAEKMDYHIIRSGRRTLAMQVTPDAEIIIRAPYRAGQAEIDRFIDDNQAWLRKHLAMAEEKKKARAESPYGEITEYEYGSFTATNLLLSIIDRRYQTIVLPGDLDRTESDLLSSMADTKLASSKFLAKAHSRSEYSEEWGVKYDKFEPVQGVKTLTLTGARSASDLAVELIQSVNGYDVCDLIYKNPFGNSKKFENCPNYETGKIEGLAEKDPSKFSMQSYAQIAKECYDNAVIAVKPDELKYIEMLQERRNFYRYTKLDTHYTGPSGCFGIFGTHNYFLDNRGISAQLHFPVSDMICTPDCGYSAEMQLSNERLLRTFLEGKPCDSSRIHDAIWEIADERKLIKEDLINAIGGADNTYGYAMDVNSLAIQENIDIKIAPIPLEQINLDDFVDDAKRLRDSIKDVMYLYNTMCSNDRELVDHKALPSITQFKLYTAKVDYAVILMYTFNEQYKELLEATYTGIIDLDDAYQYYLGRGRLYELCTYIEQDASIMSATQYSYKPRFYTTLKSLARFYQYFYGVQAHTWYSSVPTREAFTDEMHSEWNEYADKSLTSLSGPIKDSEHKRIVFRRFWLIGSKWERDEYIEPVESGTIAHISIRNKTELHAPSYFGSCSEQAVAIGKSTQLTPATTSYSTIKYMFNNPVYKMENIPQTYNPVPEYKSTISKLMQEIQVHPMNYLENAMLYTCIRSKMDYLYNALYTVDRESSKLLQTLQNGYSLENLEFYIMKHCIKGQFDKLITNAGTMEIIDYQNDLAGIYHYMSQGCGFTPKTKARCSKKLPYCADFKNLDLAISSIRGTEHAMYLYRDSIYAKTDISHLNTIGGKVWNMQPRVYNIVKQYKEHHGTYGDEKIVPVSKADQCCSEIRRWLQNPINAQKVMQFQRALRAAVINYYEPGNRKVFMSGWYKGLSIVYRLGLAKIIGPMWKSKQIRELLFSLAYARMRSFLCYVKNPMSNFSKPNKTFTATPIPAEELQELTIAKHTAAVVPQRFRNTKINTSNYEYSKLERYQARRDRMHLLYWPDLCKLARKSFKENHGTDVQSLINVALKIEAFKRFEDIDETTREAIKINNKAEGIRTYSTDLTAKLIKNSEEHVLVKQDRFLKYGIPDEQIDPLKQRFPYVQDILKYKGEIKKPIKNRRMKIIGGKKCLW